MNDPGPREATTPTTAQTSRLRIPGGRTRALATVLNLLSRFDHYRPEQHYMRGPGPKARAKARTEGQDPA